MTVRAVCRRASHDGCSRVWTRLHYGVDPPAVAAIGATVPAAAWQRCTTRYAVNLMSITRKSSWAWVPSPLPAACHEGSCRLGDQHLTLSACEAVTPCRRGRRGPRSSKSSMSTAGGWSHARVVTGRAAEPPAQECGMLCSVVASSSRSGYR